MPTPVAADLLTYSPEVAEALETGAPVVSMETSGIAGMRYPTNLDIAKAVDDAIREAGAVPARVTIDQGRVRIGLTDDELERLATSTEVPVASTRDIGPALAGGGLAAPKVSATLLFGEMAGIEVSSVAGIGGVHRNAQQTFDISPDLLQFSRSRALVVCAGAKSVLDLALTLEYLETVGVPIIGYRCDEFPAYYSPSSGLRNPHRAEDLAEVVAMVRAHWRVSSGSVLLTHPIAERDGIPREMLEPLIEEKIEEAERSGVTGPAITPYVLRAVSEATDGRTTIANRAVLVSTAFLAGQAARELARSKAPAMVAD